MGKDENARKSLPNRANNIIKRILEQAMAGQQSSTEPSDYSWVAGEIQKEQTSNVKRDLLANLFKRLNSWYEKQLDKNRSAQLSVFYLHVVYMLYTLQFDSSIIPLADDSKLLKIEMSYTIFDSFKDGALSKDAEEIISYLIYKKDLKIVLKWEEYKHISSREIQKAEEEVESFFEISESNIEAMNDYIKSKQAYLVMQSLLK
ncbi:hypothetical protein NEMIN01_0531 [Nematocida minor]|uniref:uncharacterized protein n=1 Tax=Nematocida minor TaxID=1912983 RepID=UPI00221F1D3D|nr:uncharacterized protein NEMIN01_0531 [Nematocida minor]KAI5189468.1 hypothetical protein NEMIN01_0531 [Nematocida minor]